MVRSRRLDGARKDPKRHARGRASLPHSFAAFLRGRAFLAGYFRAVCLRRRYDLYHETNFIPLPADVPTVATLHDLSVVLHPEWHPRDRVLLFERHFRHGLGRLAIGRGGPLWVVAPCLRPRK